jgi:hypothetical protein
MIKTRTSLLIAVTAFFGILFAAVCLYAGTTVSDVIEMNNPAYEKHKKSIATFTHKKHADEYAKANPDLYPNGCGDCHHNENNEPLADLKNGDDVQNCIECHKIPSKEPSTKKDEPKLTASEKLEYHAYAIHKNCKDCHKAYNKASGTKDAPTTCTKCHPKES